MSISVPLRSPHGPADPASSPTTGPQPASRAATRQAHANLVSRPREPGNSDHSLGPRNRLGPYQAHTPGSPPPMTTAPYVAPYVAPSVAGLQRVSFSAQMTPEDARASLLAMDISPQFLEAMKADLNHCTNPYAAGWSADSPRQFVATYGQLVAMPNGLDNATVAALYRMLASPEPATPTLPTSTQAAQPQPQTLPFMQMTLDDARAALQAMEVAPQTLARMTKDLLNCVETDGSAAGPECARQFQHEYGHLLAMPPRLDAAALTTLVNLLMDLPGAPPPVEPHVEPHIEPHVEPDLEPAVEPQVHAQVQPQAEPDAALDPETPEPQTTGLALHDMEPAEARQALLALNLPEPQLLDMAQHLILLDDALKDEDGDDLAQALAQEFVLKHGHLIELPTQVEPHTLRAMARMLISPAPEDE